MQEGTLPILITKNTKTPFYFSITIFGIIIIVTIGLIIRNIVLSSATNDFTDAIAQKKAEILDLSKDRNVIVTKILSTNTIPTTIDLKGILANFRDVAAKANVRLKGFSVNHDTISTTLIATEGNPNIHPDPASTIVTLMKAYTTETGDGNFVLEPIISIGGTTQSRTTGITLKVLPSPTK